VYFFQDETELIDTEQKGVAQTVLEMVASVRVPAISSNEEECA
jgi:hypothetical protein